MALGTILIGLYSPFLALQILPMFWVFSSMFLCILKNLVPLIPYEVCI